MRIEGLATRDEGGTRTASARLVFEAGDGRETGLWFRGEDEATRDLAAAPEAFLLAALPLALLAGEPRVLVEGRACAALRRGLEEAMLLHARWSPRLRPLAIEATGGFEALRPRSPARTACLLSGGVDSLSLLAANVRAHPEGHPGRIRDAIHLGGYHRDDVVGGVEAPARRGGWEAQRDLLRRLAASRGVTLLPVWSNVRSLLPDWASWRDVAWGAAMLAAAHALAGRLTDVWFASHDAHALAPIPHGAHPLLDPHYGSAAVAVHTGEPCRGRLAKVGTLLAWPEALAVLQVCLAQEPPPPGALNCGRCEKCLGTLLAFEALGRPDAAVAFPPRGPTAEAVRGMRVEGSHLARYLAGLRGPLAAAGRGDLARALARPLRRYERKRRRGRVA